MTQQQGWIKLYRSLLENPLWQEKRKFSRAEAWIDILLMVNHKDEKVLVNGKLVEVRMGNKVTSIKDLAERWDWSKDKVTNFLKLLQAEDMIEYKPETKYTLVTVLKWDFYQSNIGDDRNQNGTETESEWKQVGNELEPERNQTGTNKNDKNIKNDKNDKKKDINACFESLWQQYPIKKGKGSVSDTQKAKLYTIGVDEVKRAIERYCADNTNTDLQYWKHGSTFFNSGYVDYLDANYSQPNQQTEKKPVSGADNFTHKKRDFSHLEE